MPNPPGIVRETSAASSPGAGSSVRRKTIVPREGRYWLLATTGLWLTGWLKGINLILVLAYVLYLLWGLNWLTARRAMRGVTIRRKFRGPIVAGAPVGWEVEASADSRRPLTGWEVLDDGPDHSLRWFLLNVPPGEIIRLRREVTPPHRGPYVCRPLRAASSFPFGLVRQEVEYGGDERVMVLPRLGTIHVGRLRRWLMQSARPDERARRTRRRLALEAEFHGLRQFRPGDSPRWIHWRTTARTGELVVREFDQGSHDDLLLIVEPYAMQPNSPAIDAAVSLAATICWAWSREGGDRVVLAIAGPEPTALIGGDRPDAVTELLECLAPVRGSATTDIDGLARHLEQRLLPSGPALLVSSRTDDRTAGELARRLDRPVAFLNANEPPSFYQPPSSTPS